MASGKMGKRTKRKLSGKRYELESRRQARRMRGKVV